MTDAARLGPHHFSASPVRRMIRPDTREDMTDLLEAPRFGEVQSQPGFTAGLERTCAFIAEKKMNMRVAIQALHGHYHQSRDERVLEFVDGDVLRTRVATSGETADMDLVPTVVGFQPDGTQVPLQWAVGMPDGAFNTDLSELGRFLVANKLTGIFVAVRLPLAVPVTPGKTVLFEKTNKAARTQESRIRQRSTVPSCDDATWIATDDGTPIAIACCHCKKCA